LTLKHAFESLQADNAAHAALGYVLPSHWNDDHVLETPSGSVLYTGANPFPIAGEAAFSYDAATNVLSVPEVQSARTVTSSPVGVFEMIRGELTFTPAAAAPNSIPFGMIGKVNYLNGVGDMTGGAAHIGGMLGWIVVNSPGRTVTQVLALEGKVDNTAGTILFATAGHNQISSNAGTISNAYITHSKIIGNAGSIGNCYGFYGEIDNNAGTITKYVHVGMPSFASVPGGGSITARYFLEGLDPGATSTILGTITGSHGAEIAAPAHPGIAANRYYTAPHTAIAPVAMTANLMFAVPFFCPQRKTFTKIGFEVTTAVAGNARLGVYRSGGDGGPVSLALDAGAISTGTTGVKEITISQQLEPGLYFLAIVTDNASTINWHASDPGWFTMMLGATTATAVNELSMYVIQAYGALPATYGTPVLLASTYEPHVWLRA
jgi:hypothetical protein